MIESASDISNKEFNFNTRILQNDQNEAHEFLSQEFFLLQQEAAEGFAVANFVRKLKTQN